MEWPILLLAGLAAGCISGLFGVGGGIVMVPVLHYLLGRPWPDAVALSLLAISVQAPVGLWRHHKRDSVDWRMGLAIAVGGVGGVWLGTWLEPRIGVPWLKLTFAVLMLFAAARMALATPARRPDHRPATPWLVVLGFAAGVVSRLLGVGGGILIVPVLTLLGIPPHLAVGTALLPVFSNAFTATVANLLGGLDWTQGLALAAGALLGAPLGVRAAHALPEKALRRIIAVALVIVAATIVADVL